METVASVETLLGPVAPVNRRPERRSLRTGRGLSAAAPPAHGGPTRSRVATKTCERPAASSHRLGSTRLAAGAACAVLTLEVIASLLMWAPIPIGWMWIGARVYAVTGSILADGAAVLLGFLGTTILTMSALTRLDRIWVALRRRAGHDQGEGALTTVVVVSATLGILAFLVWYYLLSHAFILPFMPTS